MKSIRPILRWLRRIALAIVLIVFIVSEVGITYVGKGDRSSLNDGSGITSAVGVFAFMNVQTVGQPPTQEPVRFEFHRYSDYAYAGYRFPWRNLGFRLERGRSPGFPYRKASNDPTTYMRPPFDLFRFTVPYWPMLLLLGWPEVLWLLRRWREKATQKLGDALSAPATADDSIIVTDLPCVHCGYNLRMQPRSGRCTECGSPIVDTLSLNAELARSRPGWLKWLSAGNAMLLLVRVVLLVIYAQLFDRDFGMMLPTALLAAALYVVGIFALTRPEHPYLQTPDRSRVRWQRGLATAMLLCVAVALWHQQYVGPGGRGRGILGFFDWATGVFHSATLELSLYGWLLFSLCIILEYDFLARLAGRLLDRFMTEHCKIAGIGAAIGGVVILFIVRMLARNDFPLSGAGMWAVVGIVVLWQLFVIWAAFMNGYCAVRFLQQAWIAERNWQNGSLECRTANAG